MKIKNILVALLLVAAFIAPSFALEADYVPMSFIFPVVSLDAASEAVSVVTFVAPENITIKSMYVTETDGVTASSTAYATFTLKDDGTAIQAKSTTTALTAMTPAAFTIATTGRVNKIAKGSVVTLAVTKVGSGVALTTPVVQLNYVIGW